MRRIRSAAVMAGMIVGGLLSAGTAGAATGVSAIQAAPQLPAGAQVTGALPAATPLTVAVTLNPTDPAALQAFATAVATPGSGVFRQYESVAQFRARFAPSAAQAQTVRAALIAAGLTVGAVSSNGLLIDASGTAAQMSRAFSTTFDQVQLAGGRVAYTDTAAPALPATVAGLVQSVTGLDSLSVPAPVGAVHGTPSAAAAPTLAPSVTTGGPQACAAARHAGGETADQLASAYSFSGLYGARDLGAGATVGLFEQEPFARSDLKAYDRCYGISPQVSNVPVDGGAGTGSGSGESILDVETVVGLAPQAHVITYSGPGSEKAFIDIYEAMVNADKAKVLSTSWYQGPCDPYTPAKVTQVEATVFAEAAAQGQSFLTASGDVGSDGCVGHKPDPGPELGDPSGQSLVTSVGGTTLSKVGPPPTETVWNSDDGASSGGISDYDVMPAYQADASPRLGIISQFSSGAPCGAPAGEYCREAPDVSADADPNTGYDVYQGGWQVYGGTSASSPLWAALLALADASPQCAGTDIGFANPLLYSLASTDYAVDFNDITVGDNDAFGNEHGLYPATPGYDMATGLGTPIGTNLAKGLCAAQSAAVTVTGPGVQTTPVGSTVSEPIAATDATGASLTYTATGLPAGLLINQANGVITGTPTTAGASIVTVTATDADGATGSASFLWRVPPA